MRWVIPAVVLALAAAIAINVLLLGRGVNRNDPVGRFSPVASLPSPSAPSAPPPASVPTTDVDD